MTTPPRSDGGLAGEQWHPPGSRTIPRRAVIDYDLRPEPFLGIREADVQEPRRSWRAVWLPVLAGAIAAASVVVAGPMALPIVFAIVLAPWLIREPFRPFLLLLVTWPVVTLYVNLSLPAGIPDLRYERLLAVVMLTVVVLGALAARRPLPHPHLAVAVFAVLQFGWYLYHVLTEGVVDTGLSILISSAVLPVTMYWLTRVFVIDRARVEALLKALVAMGLIVAFTGFYERFLGGTQSPFPVDTGTAAGTRYLDVPGGRAAGVFGNPAIYGAVLGATLLAAGALFVGTRRRVLMGSAAVIMAYGVFVSFTRSAWLSAAVALLVAYLVTSDFMRRVRRATAITIVVGVVAVAFLPGLIGQNDAIRDRALETDNVTGRVARAVFSWDQFTERPLTGWGPDALDEAIAFEFAKEGEGFDVSHNTFLTLLVDGGLLIFLAAAMVLVSWIASAFRVYGTTASQSPARYALAAMLGLVVVYVISGMALELKFFGFFTSLAWVGGAVIENLGDIAGADPAFGATIDRRGTGAGSAD